MPVPIAPWLLAVFVAAASVVPMNQDAAVSQFRADTHGLRLEVDVTTVHELDLDRLSAAAFSVQIGAARLPVGAAHLEKYEAKNIVIRCPDGSCVRQRWQRSAGYVLVIDGNELPKDGRSRDIKVTVSTPCKSCSVKTTVRPKSLRLVKD
jgi:hypothetical protein